MVAILGVSCAWLWFCSSLASVWLDSEVDGKDFDWHSGNDWWMAFRAPIDITAVIVLGVLEAIFGNKDTDKE